MQLDLLQVLQTAAAFIAGAGGLWLITEGVKRASWIQSINPGQKARIRGFVAVLAALGVLLGNVADGQLVPSDVQALFVNVLEFVTLFVGAHTVHEIQK